MRCYKKDEQRGGAGLQAETGESEAGPAAGCWLNSHEQEGVPQPDVSRGLGRATIHMEETQQSKETSVGDHRRGRACAPSGARGQMRSLLRFRGNDVAREATSLACKVCL